MRQTREILRLRFEAGLSHDQVARACRVSKGVVVKYTRRARELGLSWPLPADWDDAELERRLQGGRRGGPKPAYVLPDFATIHHELKRKGVTLLLLWQEYAAAQGEAAYSYPQFCAHYRVWRERQPRRLRQTHKAGEKLFIDYCGPTVPVTDPATGETHAAQVFVAVLGASNYTYAEATWTQGQADWLAAHTRAFAFFGGVPALLVPDNLAAAVRRANRYDPELNPSYAELASHYGTAVLPARPRKPRDKAKAETGVQLVERWILARLRHRTFFSLAELNAAIAELLADLNERPFAKRVGSRRQLFEELDSPALRALPQQPYTYGEWKRVKVGIDYHVQLERHGYSVPQRLVGERLDARISAATVELFHDGQRVASHPRRHQPGGFTTEPAHRPEAHRRHNDWQPGHFREWAHGIGASVGDVVDRQLTERPHPEHGYRACLGLRDLARRFGPERLERACAYALALGTVEYPRIRAILEAGLETQPSEPATAEAEDPRHTNVRGAAYYAVDPS